MSRIADAIFTETQQNVLGLLYSNTHRSFYTNEILRLTDMGVATIKRELDRMTAAGILTLSKQGNQIHYQANPDCPIYEELVSIVNKTMGLVEVLRESFKPIETRIDLAFVFGSVASGKESAGSDVDLLIVGEVGFVEVVSALHPAQEKLGREINPKVYSKKEWLNLLNRRDAFIKGLMSKPRMDVLGEMDESGKSDWN